MTNVVHINYIHIRHPCMGNLTKLTHFQLLEKLCFTFHENKKAISTIFLIFFFRKILAQVNIEVRWDCTFSVTRKILLLISLLSFVYFLSLSYNLCPRKSLLSTWLVPEGAVQNTKLLRLWQSRGMVRPLLPRLIYFRVETWKGDNEEAWFGIPSEISNVQIPKTQVQRFSLYESNQSSFWEEALNVWIISTPNYQSSRIWRLFLLVKIVQDYKLVRRKRVAKIWLMRILYWNLFSNPH